MDDWIKNEAKTEEITLCACKMHSCRSGESLILFEIKLRAFPNIATPMVMKWSDFLTQATINPRRLNSAENRWL